MKVPFTCQLLGLVISSVEDIEKLEGKNLLAVHNELSNAAVKKFADRKSGLKRTVKAFETWQEQQTGKTPKLASEDHKSYRRDSNRGKIIELASKAGGASVKTLMAATDWDASHVRQSLKRIEDYNGLNVAKSGEGDDEVFVVTGVLRTRKPFYFEAKSEQKPVKEDTKRGKVLAITNNKDGATFDQIKEITGWNDRTAYEGIRLLHSYSGYGIKETGDGRIITFK